MGHDCDLPQRDTNGRHIRARLIATAPACSPLHGRCIDIHAIQLQWRRPKQLHQRHHNTGH